MVIKKSIGEHVFDSINILINILFSLVFIYPLLYVLFASFSSPEELIKHSGLLMYPLKFSIIGYKVVMQNKNILIGYSNTIIYVVFGTLINMIFTSFGAYVLSRKKLLWKKPMMIFIVFTMYFNGGLMPNYLLIQALGMIDTRWALLIPGAIWTFNLIVLRTAFLAVPDSLVESAKMDGAKDLTILFRIILPVVKANIAVIAMFYAVGHWNSWFTALIYIRDRSLYPLQIILREILIQNQASQSGNTVTDSVGVALVEVVIKYCVIIVATVPVLCVYPIAQKYFISGIMVGSLKE